MSDWSISTPSNTPPCYALTTQALRGLQSSTNQTPASITIAPARPTLTSYSSHVRPVAPRTVTLGTQRSDRGYSWESAQVIWMLVAGRVSRSVPVRVPESVSCASSSPSPRLNNQNKNNRSTKY